MKRQTDIMEQDRTMAVTLPARYDARRVLVEKANKIDTFDANEHFARPFRADKMVCA